MKNFYFNAAFILWLSLLSFAAQAQEGPDTLSYRAQNDYLLAPLDKSQIPSGILYERVFPLSGLPAFTGTAAADTSHPEHFYQAFYELQQASYAQGNLPAVQQLRQTIERVIRPRGSL
ncbi:MAG: hypothetical protein EOP51_21975 [Sphingobacteriales bacterium]|nr:MAG: hypothetical protein EOP51_21975 [Sphingobacteriales bacterium]